MRKGFLSNSGKGGIFPEEVENKHGLTSSANSGEGNGRGDGSTSSVLETEILNEVEEVEQARGTLLGLPGAVLGRLWPSERVLDGTVVSRSARRRLHAHARSVEFKASPKNVMDADDVVDSFEYFRNSDLVLAWARQGAMSCSLLLNGLTRGISKGICSNLTSLDLSDNSIGDDGAKLLAWLPRAGGKLASLQLAQNDIGPHGAEPLAGVLKECEALQRINLSCNRLDAAAAALLASSLTGHAALAELELCDNILGEGDHGAEAASLLVALSATCPQLAHVGLSRNKINPAGATAIAQSLAEVRAGGGHLPLRISLAGNHVGDDAACALAESLRGEPGARVEEVDLRESGVGAEGICALVDGVGGGGGGGLHRLDVAGNQLAEEERARVENMLAGDRGEGDAERVAAWLERL